MRIFRRVKDLALEQLTQGVESKRLALGFTLACAIGIFPLLGFSTLFCAVAGYALRLNQPFLQAVNYLMAPLQLLMMPVFLRAGEWIFSQPPTPFSPVEMFNFFFARPADFLAVYGKAGALAVGAWVLITPLAGLLVNAIALRGFRGLSSAKKGLTK